VDRRPRDGALSCVTTHRTSPPWTCSLPQPLASTCSMPSSSCGWRAETSSGSTSHPHPTADWIARQITEAFPWNEAPRYLIRDRDQVYGAAVRNRLRAMGIRDKPIAPGSPWQNGFAERLIGSIRRECVDHVIALGRRTYAGFCESMPAITTICERTDRWRRTRLSRARFSGSDVSHRMRCLAGCITSIAESSFRYTQPSRRSGAAPSWSTIPTKAGDASRSATVRAGVPHRACSSTTRPLARCPCSRNLGRCPPRRRHRHIRRTEGARSGSGSPGWFDCRSSHQQGPMAVVAD
jgi:Integrase core domain